MHVAYLIPPLVGGMLIGAMWATIFLDDRPHASTENYGQWLGRECWSRKYEIEEWRRCVIVAVSWKGSVRVRPIETAHESYTGWWVNKDDIAERLRLD